MELKTIVMKPFVERVRDLIGICLNILLQEKFVATGINELYVDTAVHKSNILDYRISIYLNEDCYDTNTPLCIIDLEFKELDSENGADIFDYISRKLYEGKIINKIVPTPKNFYKDKQLLVNECVSM